MIPGENRWPLDGHDYRFIDRSNIFENNGITAFLDGTNTTLLIASKGMGKTLLLRVKKKLIIDAKSGVTLIPSSDVEFDEPKLHGSFPITGYADTLLWKDLWTFSIVISTLTHLQIFSEDADASRPKLIRYFSDFPIDEVFRDRLIEDMISVSKLVPSHYLSHLIGSYTEGELQKLRKSMRIIDDLSTRYITNAVDVFIDAFDQSLQETFTSNLGAWRAGQLGLVKAAHTLFTTNHHLKVYATIRQEAWAGFKDPDKQVIRGKSLILEPTDLDLRRMFLEAIKRYTGKPTIEEFFGMPMICNTYCERDEECFSYLLRHSMTSPRSLMQFGKALDDANLMFYEQGKRMQRIRDVINDTSEENIFGDYLESQKQMFMTTLNSEKRLKSILNLIPSNVLTAASLRSINKKFCQLNGINDERKSPPCCELFNSGLIGQVRFDNASGGYFQYFRKQHEFDWNQQEILGGNAIYVLHPGLVSYLAKTNHLHLNKFNIIGYDQPWKKDRGHSGIPTVFISHSSEDKSRLEPFLLVLQDELNLILPTEFWIDTERIMPGDRIHDEIESGIKSTDILVLFASKTSLNSGWVEEEWRTKHQREIEEHRTRVIVALIDDIQPDTLSPLLSKKLAARCSLHGDMEANAQFLAKAIAGQCTKLLDHVFERRGFNV